MRREERKRERAEIADDDDFEADDLARPGARDSHADATARPPARPVAEGAADGAARGAPVPPADAENYMPPGARAAARSAARGKWKREHRDEE